MDEMLSCLIVAKDFVYRLGLKTMVAMLQPDLLSIEHDTLDSARYFIDNNPSAYLLIHENVFTKDALQQLIDLRESNPKLVIIIFGDGDYDEITSCVQVYSEDNHQLILEKLQKAFTEGIDEHIDTSSDQLVLSDRESDILKLVAKGLSNKEIADQLCISINTVITHRKNITEKLGIKSIAGLTVYAMINGLIQADDVEH